MDERLVTLLSAYFANNKVPPKKIREVIQDFRGALEGKKETGLVPAVPIEESIQHDHLVCLEDGKHLKVLKRYLREQFDMTPEEYREKWGLPEDYPMVCQEYSDKRSGIAKSQGLGKDRVKKR